MPIGTPDLPLDIKTIEVKLDDLIAIGRFEDHPRQLSFLCEREHEGKRERRAIFFPDDPGLCASLAQVLMEFAGIQAISISKKRGAHITFGPKSAGQMLDRTLGRSGPPKVAKKKPTKKKG